MNGKLNQAIIELFRAKFEENCIYLLIESYNSILSAGRKLNEDNENSITAQLVGYMKKSSKRADLQIHLDRESYLDDEATFKGETDADKSPRIDIKYATWNANSEFEYYMEAKNLAENNWVKSTNVTVNAASLRKRYVETGIGNFISGRYPNGCLLGYILEGDFVNIANLINEELIVNKRTKEILVRQVGYGIDFHYCSTHSGTAIKLLKHFFLNLA